MPGTVKEEPAPTNPATQMSTGVSYPELQRALQEMPEYPGVMNLTKGKVSIRNPLDESLTEAVATQLHQISLEAQRTEDAKRVEAQRTKLEKTKSREETFQEGRQER